KYFSAPFGTDPASEKLERAARIFGSRSCIMRVCVGHISAHCDKCGCQDFQPLFAESSNAHEMACFSCGVRTTRRALLMQIAEETVKRAQAFIELSKKARNQPRKH